jgi:hypothetical protein
LRRAQGGGTAGRALAVVALLFSGRLALAHSPGLSVAEFEVQPAGRVLARLTFASAEALGGLSLGREGVVTPEDVSAAQEDLRAFLLRGVGVDADGSACAPTFRGAALTDVDGLVLDASYACPGDAADIQVTLYYLSALPRGVTHKGIARIVAGSAVSEAVLSGDHRAIDLRLPVRARRISPRRRWLAALALGAVAGLLLACRARGWALVLQKWRLLRKMR